MKQSFNKFVFSKLWSLLVLLFIQATQFMVLGQNGSIKLDDFNRINNIVIGTPSSGGAPTWQETESASSNNYRVRIESNMMVLGSYNSASGGVGSSATEQVSYDVSNRYATVFNQAASNLSWYFNMRQSRTSPSGFGSGFYGVAYVLGSTEANFLSTTANGYAVVIGNASSPDPVKLVRFTGGLNANSNLTTLITSTEETVNAYYSLKVSFDPCAKTWTLQVRNDGTTTFADPTTIASTALIATDQLYTNSDLKFIGAAYSHGTANEKTTFDNIYIPTASAAAPVTYVWNGSVSTNYDDAGNWTPNRTCFRLSDILSLNSGGTITLSNISTQEIGQLLVENNTNLILKAKAGSTQTISLSGGTGDDLLVASGSNLTIDSNDPLEINLKTGATGKIEAVFTMQNTAASLGRAHRLLAADANAITFESGSQFIARNLSGEPFGNTGTANIITFKANSTYLSKDGASPFGLTSPNSKVIFETGSLYKHEQTGTAPKFDGRVYADFELNVANSLAIIFGTSAATTTRIDNLTISSGTMNITLASGSTPLPLNIKGNLTVATGALLNFNPAAAVNTSLISFNGTIRQQISGNIYWGVYSNLEVNNPAGINLLAPLTVRGNLQLTSGLISGSDLIFADNASVSGASNSSFVEGKVYKTGNDAFTFPTGKNGFYAPVAISAPVNITDQYKAEYFRTDPSQIYGSAKGDSLVQISNVEYWDLERTNGTSEVKVSLSYDPARSAGFGNLQDLRIAHFETGNGWINEGRSEVSSLQNLALYATRNAQTSFSPFTFASVTGNDPLPVALVRFDAISQDKFVKLIWETASEQNNDYFEIERSNNGSTFEKIGEVKGEGNYSGLKRYTFEDKNYPGDVVYYRLKQVDLDGAISYSKIVKFSGFVIKPIIRVYPNPASSIINVALTGIENIDQVQVLNIYSQVVKTVNGNKKSGQLSIDISNLPAGAYFIKLDVSQPIVRFIKEN